LSDRSSIPRGFHLSYGQFQDTLSDSDLQSVAFSVILASEISEEDQEACSRLFKLSFPTELTDDEKLEEFWENAKDAEEHPEKYLVLGRVKQSNTRLGLEANDAVCVCVVTFNTRSPIVGKNHQDLLDTAVVSAVVAYPIRCGFGNELMNFVVGWCRDKTVHNVDQITLNVNSHESNLYKNAYGKVNVWDLYDTNSFKISIYNGLGFAL